jgi:hypothetical protein
MPTLVMNTPQGNQPVVPGAIPVYNPTNVKGKDSVSIPLLIAVVALAVLAGSALTYLLVSGSSNDSGSSTSSATPEANRNRKTENTTSTNSAVTTNTSNTTTTTTTNTTTPSPVTSSTTNTNTRPAGATGYAVSKYMGVNIRESPTKESTLIKTVNKGQGMWVFRESSYDDEIYIRSENSNVRGRWSEVQLDNDPSVRGWVFNGFISK